MKKIKIILTILCVCLISCMLSGCIGIKLNSQNAQVEDKTETVKKEETAKPEIKKEETEEKKLSTMPWEGSKEFWFSSGVGGWATIINIKKDGSFTGEFSDSNMGETGDGYPGGTVYVCEFSGKFEMVGQIDEHSWSLKLADLDVKDYPQEEWIEEEVLYIASGPYGIDDGKRFILYTPDAPVANMNEEFLSWWPKRYFYDDEPPTVLTMYGIYNVDEGYGWFE